jgi:hypothetical protein
MLFRRLADEGRIVVMVTHKFEKFRKMPNFRQYSLVKARFLIDITC